MNMENELQRLKAIAGGSLTADDRAFIIELSHREGLDFAPKRGCGNCYADQAIRLWQKISDKEEPKTKKKWVLRKGVDVYFGYERTRVNAATLTDELAEQIVARGFDLRFFAKKPKK